MARVISAFTLRQYEHALSQISKGIKVSFGSHLLRKLGGDRGNPSADFSEHPDAPGVPRVRPGKTARMAQSFLDEIAW